jgi:hypothetical protein
VGIDEIPALVVREHTKYIKDTQMDKHVALLERGIFLTD